MSTEWERGFAAGYASAIGRARSADARGDHTPIESAARKAPKRKPTAANRRYSAAFKKVAPRFKTKAGKWVKGGFGKASRAAHKLVK